MNDRHVVPITDIARFENGEIDPDEFDHASHVYMAFAMTQAYSFDESITRYSRGLRKLCAKAGKPGKFNMTITVAFLAAVGERGANAGTKLAWSDFALANSDLFDRQFLSRWYTADVLRSALARETFVLPKPPAPTP